MEERKFAVVEKQFEYKGHDCICVFTCLGFRNGYVSVDMPVDYDDLDIECHGGLTFSGELPSYYKPSKKYYIGFDCGHCGDGVDKIKAVEYGLISEKEALIIADIFGEPVRDTEYIEEQCKKIVDQLESGEV